MTDLAAVTVDPAPPNTARFCTVEAIRLHHALRDTAEEQIGRPGGRGSGSSRVSGVRRTR